LIKRFRDDALPLVACQKLRKTQGLSHETLAPCAPLIDTIPSQAVRRECAGSLQYQLETAKTLGLDQVGLPISSAAIASLFGVAKQHGVGETQDAARIALRLPAFCGLPTREEAEQVLDVSVVRQPQVTGQVIALTKQRREGLGHPERLERLSITQGPPPVELRVRPKHRSNHPNIVQISMSSEELYGPQLRTSTGHRRLEKAASPGRRETALTF
jgi:hypothetical protein